MMDLLIQVTTAHKVNPGGHIIHVVSDNRLISYKPSTPIGKWRPSGLVECFGKVGVGFQLISRPCFSVACHVSAGLVWRVSGRVVLGCLVVPVSG